MLSFQLKEDLAIQQSGIYNTNEIIQKQQRQQTQPETIKRINMLSFQLRNEAFPIKLWTSIT